MRSEEEIISKIGKLGDERLKIASKELKACQDIFFLLIKKNYFFSVDSISTVRAIFMALFDT